MELWIVIMLFIIGIVFIVKGGDYFVDAAVWIAEVSGLPKFLIGATVVSIATTLPELIVSLLAAGQGKVDMAAGNAVGSVTVNVGMIMGISILFMPAIAKRSKMAFKMILMLFAIGLLWFFSRTGFLSIGGSIILLCLFLIYMVENIVMAKQTMGGQAAKAVSEVEEFFKPKQTPKVIAINCTKFIVGTIGIVGGSSLLVNNGSLLATAIGKAAGIDPVVMEGIISVTVIAIGTSLPELVTTITAIRKKQSSLSVGNIIGANIIDLTVILPLCAIVSGKALPVSDFMINLNMPVCLLVCMVAVVPPLIIQKLKRWQGIALMGIYSGYIVYMIYSIL